MAGPMWCFIFIECSVWKVLYKRIVNLNINSLGSAWYVGLAVSIVDKVHRNSSFLENGLIKLFVSYNRFLWGKYQKWLHFRNWPKINIVVSVCNDSKLHVSSLFLEPLLKKNFMTPCRCVFFSSMVPYITSSMYSS